MVPSQDWLERLNRAVSYRELQEIFDAMRTAAETGGGGAGLVASIDEAIRRLEAERARDQQELAEVEASYAAFKDEQRGVVGWFKRHVPFTKTRQQELEHRGSVADQAAEILADNLVIARAQMLKERLANPPARRLGQRLAHWRQCLTVPQSPASVQELGNALRDMGAELPRGRQFLDALAQDIDAFASAAFTTKEDRQRRDADLAAARAEFEALQQEDAEKRQLRKQSLQRAGAFLLDLLRRTDASFRDEEQRAERLRDLARFLAEAMSGLQSLAGAAKEVNELLEDRQRLPAEREQIARSLAESERDQRQVREIAARAAQALERERQAFDAVQRDAEKAKHAFELAERMYNAHYGGAAPAPGQVAQAELSNVDYEYYQAREALDTTRERLSQAQRPYEQARQEAERTKAEVDKRQRSIDDMQQNRRELEERARKLESEVSAVQNRVRRLFEEAQRAGGAYFAAARNGGFSSAWRPHEVAAGTRGWISASGPGETLLGLLLNATGQQRAEVAQVIEQMRKWLASDKATQDNDLSQSGHRRQAAFEASCRAQLGDSLAEEVLQEFKLQESSP